jgi:uncharacterized protein YggE
MKRLAIAAALLLAAAALAGVARPEGARAIEGATDGDSVTVTGSASVTSAPNRAVLSLGVDSRADTARAAIAANAKEMRKVIDAVRAAGGRDVSTQSVALSPVTDENGAVTGYAASNVVTAAVDLGRAGAVIDAAVEAGANQVWGPSLSSSEQRKLYLQALKGAVDDAREKAQALAAASGRSLGKVTTVVEGGSSTPLPFAEKAVTSDAGTPVVGDSQETTATVTVTFALG